MSKKQPRRRLTLKQKKFVRKFLETGNATEAASESYNAKDRVVAASIGKENLQKPQIIDELDIVMQEEGIEDRTILRALKTNLEKGAGVKARAADSNRAAELLLKIRGKLGGQQEGSKSLTFHQHYHGMTKTELMKERKKLQEFWQRVLG